MEWRVIFLFALIGFLGSVGSGVAIRIMFPERANDTNLVRGGALLGTLGVFLAIGFLPALGCVAISLVAGHSPNNGEVLGLALLRGIVFIEVIVLAPVSYKLAGRILDTSKL